MFWLPLLTCAIFGLISTIYIFFKKKYSYWKDRGVCYLEPSFPTGNLSFRQHLKDFVVNVYNNRKNDNHFVGAYIIWKPVLVITNLDLIQNVLVKDFSNFNARGMYVNEEDDPLSAHMFSLDGGKWKSIRSKLSPTFTSGKIKFMFRTVVEVADRFNIVLAKMIQDEPDLDLKDLIGRFNMDVIGSCAFGIYCNCLNDSKAIFRQYAKKVLRKYPPAVLLVRKTAQNYQLPNSEVTIEEGTELFIPVYAIHHDPQIYSNPDVFDPERFAPDSVKSRHPMSFLAFGGGPRNCIGLRFARMQSRVGLVTLLKNYRIRLSAITSPLLTFDPAKPVLTPKDKLIFRIEKV